MDRLTKETLVERYSDQIGQNKEFLIFDFGKLTNQSSWQLRKELRDFGSSFFVIPKNVLNRSLSKAYPEVDFGIHTGRNALLFFGESYEAMKNIFKLMEDKESGVLMKTAFIEGKLFVGEDLSGLASLGNKMEMISKLICQLRIPMYKLLLLLKEVGKRK